LVLGGTVILEETLGHEVLTHVDLGGQEIVVRGSEHLTRDDGKITVRVESDSLHFFSKRDGERIDAGPAHVSEQDHDR
ncbi:MAG: hypothetical protein OEN01_14335, partial [Candidatus Krumholzibacteria bacterium]|nr:hypothetical protein [Candidatus Krumholzibacteria bacterium]